MILMTSHLTSCLTLFIKSRMSSFNLLVYVKTSSDLPRPSSEIFDNFLLGIRYYFLCVSLQDAMLIYGGLTEYGADDSLWLFNVTTRRWNKVIDNVCIKVTDIKAELDLHGSLLELLHQYGLFQVES